MSTPVAPTRLSAVEAAQQAIEITRERLFPFRFDYWLPLAFLAFLDQCGRTGAGPPAGGGTGSNGPPDVGGAADWLGANVGTAVLIAAAVLAVVVAVGALVLWINSRGIFMYLDAVATGRADVARPWREHAERAGSLFAWRFGLAAAGLLLTVAVVSVAVLGAFGVREGRVDSGVALGLGLLVLLPIFGVAVFALVLVSVALRDFVAPLQMRHDLGCGAALEMFIEILRASPGTFVVYVLLKVVYAVALGVVSILVGCATCCIGFLPVVAQLLLQPAHYFERAWSLCLLRQAGHDVLRPGPSDSGLQSLQAPPSNASGPPPAPPPSTAPPETGPESL